MPLTKDMPDGKMTSVGDGTIGFADYVENDQSLAPYLPNIQTSFTALSRLRA